MHACNLFSLVRNLFSYLYIKHNGIYIYIYLGRCEPFGLLESFESCESLDPFKAFESCEACPNFTRTAHRQRALRLLQGYHEFVPRSDDSNGSNHSNNPNHSNDPSASYYIHPPRILTKKGKRNIKNQFKPIKDQSTINQYI